MKTENPEHRLFTTRNTQLAAALAAFGVPFDGNAFHKFKHTDGRVTVHWTFATQSDDHPYSTKELADWWHDDSWFDQNYPKHPWALVMSALHAHNHLVTKIKEEPAQISIRRKSATWLVYEGSELHKKLSKKL